MTFSFKPSRPQNPYVIPPYRDGGYMIGFQVPYDSEPLFWTGRGFKNMASVRTEPQEFSSQEEAEAFIKDNCLDFIKKWRADQVELIRGW